MPVNLIFGPVEISAEALRERHGDIMRVAEIPAGTRITKELLSRLLSRRWETGRTLTKQEARKLIDQSDLPEE